MAGLLELARLLGALSEGAPRIELVAFTSEEPPHFRKPEMGSVRHAESIATEDAEVLILEMIGYFDDAPESQDYPSAYLEGRMPDRGDFVVVIGRSADEAFVESIRDAMSVRERLPIYAYAAPPTSAGVDFSDHRSYWPHGLPAAMVTDTAFLRNHAYHTADDTPDRLDYERMAAVVDGAYAWLVQPR